MDYIDTNGIECGPGLYQRTQKGSRNSHYQVGNIAWVTGLSRCCLNSHDQIDHNGNCVESAESLNDYWVAVDTGFDGNDNYAAPVYRDTSNDGWRECDASATFLCNDVCGNSQFILAGESGVGEYESSEQAQTNGGLTTQGSNEYGYAECCGDDAGENYVTAGVGPSRCCNNSNDCVDEAGNCRSGNEGPSYNNCNDGIDNDCDGAIDVNDSQCIVSFAKGDINHDGVVDFNDIVQVLINWFSSGPFENLWPDVNGDGKVNGLDFVLVIKDS